MGEKNITYIIGQVVGAVALAFLISTYFKKDKASITRTMIISNAFYVAHYFIIGALSGSYALFIAIFRDYYIYLREKHHKKHRHRSIYNNVLVHILIVIIYASLIAVNFENPMNALPLVAGLYYFAFEWFGNKLLVKAASGTASIMWLAYDVTNLSIPGIITDVFSISACIIGLIRDDKRRHPKKRK